MPRRIRSMGLPVLALIGGLASAACPLELPTDDTVRFFCSSDSDCPAFARCRAKACWPLDGGREDALINDGGNRDQTASDLARPDQLGIDRWRPDAALPDAAGCVNHALQFTGSQWQATDPAADLDVTSALTIEAWIRPTAQSLPTTGFIYIVSHNHPTPGSGYVLGIANKALELRIYGSRAGGQSVRSSIALRPGVWQHVAGSFDGRWLRVFIDGVLRGERDIGNDTVVACGEELRVGNAAATAGYFFFGEIDEVRVSRVARYAADFARPMAPPAADRDAIVVWHFDEGSGQTTADATGVHQGRLGDAPVTDPRDPTWIEVPCVPALGG